MSTARLTAQQVATANAELDSAPPEQVLAWAFERLGRVAIVASFQAESSVLIDMACRLKPGVEVITLDTDRLPPETTQLIDVFRDRYPIELRVITPHSGEVRTMTQQHGVDLFYRSADLRRQCCDVRKSRPLARALEGVDAWVTGLRREQSSSRADAQVVALDAEHGGIVKLAPLAHWSHAQVWDYIRSHSLPYHALYEQGYTSIGCAPCTRATQPGDDARAGRWWWETDEVKECGLHPWSSAPGAAADAANLTVIEGDPS